MKRLTFIVIAAALLWSGYWLWMANAQKSGIAAWFDYRRSIGMEAEYSDLQVLGFPNRLDTTVTEPRLGNPRNGIFWEAPFLQLFRLSYDASHLIMVLPDRQSYTTPRQTATIYSTDMRASLELADVARWEPERLIVVGEGLDIASDANWDLGADVVQVSLELMEDTDASYRLALDARGIEGTLPGFEISGANDQQPGIERLTADVEVVLTEPLGRKTLEVARPQPMLIRLNLAEAVWADINLAAAGQLEITPSGTPVGLLTVKVRNWRDMLEKEREAGRLAREMLDRIDFTMTLISGLSGDPTTLDLPFEFIDGRIWLGPMMLGNAPRIIIR